MTVGGTDASNTSHVPINTSTGVTIWVTTLHTDDIPPMLSDPHHISYTYTLMNKDRHISKIWVS